MVVTASLSHMDTETLTPVFNRAFADYDIPLSLTHAELKAHLDAIDYSREDSMGLFDRGALVGFLLIGRRGSAAYDGGTAIIPSHRGRGLSHLLIEATAAHLKEQGCTAFTLEVLSTNTRAKELYLKHHFEETRTLSCYQAARQRLVSLPTMVDIEESDAPFTASHRYPPSWQNQNRSINAGGYTHLFLRRSGSFIGSAASHRMRGSIAQIVLNDEYNDTEIMKEVIIATAQAMESKMVRIINIDERDTVLSSALDALGGERFALQSEMVRQL
ncbi:MAG TPA: GNAT family N-acetyltransferase [Sphaerochaeta sp.]|nr:GNAT family N-acetyltransferase [Sphaerochaeta sp.]HQB90395.1 GNAT family N-acetyltransferase [Sphaerochaeta sp.]